MRNQRLPSYADESGAGESGGSQVGFDDTIPMNVPRGPRRRRRRLLLGLLVLLLVVVSLLVAATALAYEQPRLMTPLTSLLLPAQPGAVPWNGLDRINILAMGVDQRTTEQAHSDVMMIISLDPGARRVTMLSIPRDMWVQLPEGGEGKINSAYAIGGAHYAELAVASALGVPINYYAVVKFGGFKDLIDALGGVTIDVTSAIDDPTYPADVGNGYKPLHIPAGVQHMDGTVALEYVRTRHDDPRGDVGRNARQQDVLLALQRQALTPATLLRLPAVLGALQNAVDTDLPHNRLPDVVSLIGHARGGGITRESLTPENGDVAVSTSWDGQWIFMPNWAAINALTQRLFADPRLAAEHATVTVQNGTATSGLARLLGIVLERDGFTLAEVSQAASAGYRTSEVIVHDPAVAYSGRTLAAMLHATLAEGPAAPPPAGSPSPQITVIVGANFPGAAQ